MKIEHAKRTDITAIVHILDDARVRIGKLGIDQWQDGYPNREVVEDDISRGQSYVARGKTGELLAVFALLTEGEPTYDTIYDGAWLSGPSGRYAAIHRIAVAEAQCGRGIASQVISHICRTCRSKEFESIRIDTHLGNLPMRRMLEKNGFSYCGIIHLTNGDLRVAYEKKLK